MKNRTALSALSLVLVSSAFTAVAAEKYLERGAKEWKYSDGAVAPKKNWNTLDFDDEKWKSGQALLGYGDDDVKHKLSFGDDPSNKRVCVYLRRIVDVKEPNAVKKVAGKVVCDDGCAIYLNGKEVYRFNLPEGEIKHDTTANFTMSGNLERHAMTFLVDADKFKAGKNVVAVRLHQANPSSSDLAFDLSLKGLADDEEIEAAEEQFEAEQDAIEELVDQAF